MNSDYQGGEGQSEKLDADAVCIQCGTVNAEGTLLCKVCGNNLRDQRSRRMTTDQALETGETGLNIRNWLSPVMFLLAVTLILFTLFNQDAIVNWMVGVQSSEFEGPELLWLGNDSGELDELVDELRDNMPTEEQALAARDDPAVSDGLSGIYALFADGVYVGAANARFDDDGFYFSALLESGEQVRGRAISQGTHYIMVPDDGGVRSRNQMRPVRGVASPKGNGVIECVGDDSLDNYSCMAYAIKP